MCTSSESIFTELREKLDILGYTHTLPVLAIPLVGALLSDFLHTTEKLRDSKQKIYDLLEEKSCWELGVEPFKCSNARLIKECSDLNQQLLKEREEFDWRLFEYDKKMRNLQTDKQHIEAHSQQLQQKINSLTTKQIDAIKPKVLTGLLHKTKKPFISTVRSGEALPPVHTHNVNNLRCTKCNVVAAQQQTVPSNSATEPFNNVSPEELSKLQNSLRDSADEIEIYKRKFDGLNREVLRLNNLLSGGQPPAALAKSCCQKMSLAQDINTLQNENEEYLAELANCKDKMHDAMQKALQKEDEKIKIEQDLKELRNTALQVETQANIELAARENENHSLQRELKDLRMENNTLQQKVDQLIKVHYGRDKENIEVFNSKHSLNEKLNFLTQQASGLKSENEKLRRKLQKMQMKLCATQKDQDEVVEHHQHHNDNNNRMDAEKAILKSERDFFQNEYLRISKGNFESQIEYLKTQLKMKDDELNLLRSAKNFCDLNCCDTKQPQLQQQNSLGQTPRTDVMSVQSSSIYNGSSDCVKAILMRVQHENDCARAELERIIVERDMLRDKNLDLLKTHAVELKVAQQHNEELCKRLSQLERKNHELNSDLLPKETHITLLKREIEQFKECNFTLQKDLNKLEGQYAQLKMLNEQNERTIVDYQNKLTLAEHQSQRSDLHAANIDSNSIETVQLKCDLAALRKENLNLNNEKDTLLNKLDAKTEYSVEIEQKLKNSKGKQISLENEVEELKTELIKYTTDSSKNCKVLNDALDECTTLRKKIGYFKKSSEDAIAENGRLANELSSCQAEIRILQNKLANTDSEINCMKQQLRQYVQKVKKAEDLLSQKERERDEMLDHYQSLSQDAVILEGNNQSLELEATESKRLIHDLEAEIFELKKENCCRKEIIAQLEDKISALTVGRECLEHQLEECKNSLRICNEDLSAQKELCDKLDNEKEKLNAELSEIYEIRKKLEKENNKLRDDLSKINNGHNASYEAMAEILATTRRELEQQVTEDAKLNQELERLRKQLDKVKKDLKNEQEACEYQKKLTHDFEMQAEELRQSFTNERFQAARTAEENTQTSP